MEKRQQQNNKAETTMTHDGQREKVQQADGFTRVQQVTLNEVKCIVV